MVASVSERRSADRPDSGVARGRRPEAARRALPLVSELAEVTARRAPGPRARLELGRSDDPLEHEADRVAERLTAAPGPGRLRRACACGGTPGPDGECAACKARRLGMQRKPAGAGPGEAPAIVHEVLSSPGRPLDPATRADMEHGLGRDLGGVRVHTGDRAAASSRAVGARAYTVGADIVFDRGRYAPRSPEGRRLLAHELAHVAQQGAGPPLVQRQDEPSRLERITPPRPMGATACGIPGTCPPTFCQPFDTRAAAYAARQPMVITLLAGIASQVDSRVVPLWYDHIFGGGPPRDLTSTFAGDFQHSRSTARTVNRLVTELRRTLFDAPPTFSPGTTEIIVPLSSLIGPTLLELGNPASHLAMDFDQPDEVPGNIAGGVGNDQLTCAVGAMPSPFNDVRKADGRVTLIRDDRGTLMVQLVIDFLVMDTLDLCPGNCGTDAELTATLPLSWFEASGISGDVPFSVRFSVPVPPFVIRGAMPPVPVGPPAPAVPPSPPAIGPTAPLP